MALITPATSSLLVMDMQNEVLDARGCIGSHGMAAQATERRATENTAMALSAARSHGISVIHVGMSFRKGYPDLNGNVPILGGIKEAGGFLEGSWGSEFHPAVKPLDGEPIVFKRGVSAFAGTDLSTILRIAGIDTLVLAGVATNFVVEATARQAVDEGYRVVVLKDCCATLSEQMHNSALELLGFIGTVATVADFASSLS